MECYYLNNDGKCDGRYKGFACIGVKCRAEKEPPCQHYELGYYCRKYRRFGCPGQSKCEAENHPEIKVKATREKART